MQKIAKGKPEQLEEILTCFELSSYCEDPSLSKEGIEKALDEGELFLIEQGKSVLGFAIATRDIYEAMPSSLYYDIQEEVGIEETNLVFIHGFYIRSTTSFNEKAKFLFDYLDAYFEKPIYIIQEDAPITNEKEKYLLQHQARLFKKDEQSLIYIKKRIKRGLARELNW